jgi:hypothetical protein
MPEILYNTGDTIVYNYNHQTYPAVKQQIELFPSFCPVGGLEVTVYEKKTNDCPSGGTYGLHLGCCAFQTRNAGASRAYDTRDPKGVRRCHVVLVR